MPATDYGPLTADWAAPDNCLRAGTSLAIVHPEFFLPVKMILAGDIGGTKVNLAGFESDWRATHRHSARHLPEPGPPKPRSNRSALLDYPLFVPPHGSRALFSGTLLLLGAGDSCRRCGSFSGRGRGCPTRNQAMKTQRETDALRLVIPDGGKLLRSSVIARPTQQLVVQAESQPQHFVTVTGADALAHAHGTVAAIEASAHAEAEAAAVTVTDPFRDGFAVTELCGFVRRAKFAHSLIVCVVTDAAVPVNFRPRFASGEHQTRQSEQQAQRERSCEGESRLHIRKLTENESGRKKRRNVTNPAQSSTEKYRARKE